MQNQKARIGAIVALGITIVIAAIIYFLVLREDRLFQVTQESEKGDIKGIIEACEHYLNCYPNGKNAPFVRTKLEEVSKNIAQADYIKRVTPFKTEIKDVLSARAYNKTRMTLLKLLEQNSNDIFLLLKLGFLTWGVDDFSSQAFEKANEYINRVLQIDPENKIANQLKKINESHHKYFVRKCRQDTSQLNEIKESGITQAESFVDQELFVLPGIPIKVKAGQKTRLSPSGRQLSIIDKNGELVWLLENDQDLGIIGIDCNHEKHVFIQSYDILLNKFIENRLEFCLEF